MRKNFKCNIYSSHLSVFVFLTNLYPLVTTLCVQDLQLALEKARSALQEREEQLKEAEQERQRQDEERETTIRELRTSLLTKEQLIEVRHRRRQILCMLHIPDRNPTAAAPPLSLSSSDAHVPDLKMISLPRMRSFCFVVADHTRLWWFHPGRNQQAQHFL